ncbi:MAG: helix-hairpin-helix domain-containing protein [Bacteroidales bacterium]|nr:helix-hairpin-helix domain-containing protein [Bacteroidales bacterium]
MEKTAPPQKKSERLSASAKTGAIALVFLIIGFEAALFIHRAAVTALVAHRDAPDTVYIIKEISPRTSQNTVISSEGEAVAEKSFVVERHSPPRTDQTVRTRDNFSPRKVESFRFDPNTASLDDFMRLGFSEKQAQAIINYREKGGRFRRADDFAKSYVVADSVFERLRPYIDIPKLDINRADSAAFTSLPGIGPYFAGKIVQYRTRLCGFSYKEQLLEIYRFDQEKYDGLSDLISCSAPAPYPLWSLPEADLKQHPYIGQSAHGIVLYRTHNAADALTVDGLLEAGVISADQAAKLRRIRIAEP